MIHDQLSNDMSQLDCSDLMLEVTSTPLSLGVWVRGLYLFTTCPTNCKYVHVLFEVRNYYPPL